MYVKESANVMQPQPIVDWMIQNIPARSVVFEDPTGPVLPKGQFKLRMLTYQDFQQPLNLRDAEYLCISEDMFNRLPEGQFVVLKEFPAQTKSFDRSFRIYGR